MDEIYNHYSFLWIAWNLRTVAGPVPHTSKPKPRDFVSFEVIVACPLVEQLMLQTKRSKLMSDGRGSQSSIGVDTRPGGVSVSYWNTCAAQKSIVDGLETEHRARLRILRINVRSPDGRQIAPVYDFQYTPSYSFFDAQGPRRWRTIREVDLQEVRASAASQN
jgi:hypothetical protein